MHEMSLAEGVLGVGEDALRGEPGGVQVRSVRLEIGQLATVEIDALRFSFDVVKRGSVAELFREGRARDTLWLWLSFFMTLLSIYSAFSWLPTMLTT